jgi:DNA-binding response OmpR family regulator
MSNTKINILLAEDDENLGNLLCNYLKNKGHDVVLAKNGKRAYDFFNDPKKQL